MPPGAEQLPELMRNFGHVVNYSGYVGLPQECPAAAHHRGKESESAITRD